MSAASASVEIPSAVSRPVSRARGWRARVGLALLLSGVALTPCFWHSRIQAGDLSSHIYNAWLASLIAQGKAEGLVIVTQRTNVLFDLMLSSLFKTAGAEAAQRIAVSACVLIFVWGAFAWICVMSRRRPWFLFPCVMMLAYGWVFHMGFFNFYLSLGLCFWALAFSWTRSPLRALGSVALLVLACAAHLLPVAWAIGVIPYVAIARAITPRHRILLAAAGIGVLALFRIALSTRLATRWSLQQALEITGVDQLWVFGPRYGVLAVALLVVWTAMFLHVARRGGMAPAFLGIPFQLFLLTAAGVLLLPTAVLLPGYKHALWYISDRMSLVVAVLVCGILARGGATTWHKAAVGSLALLFFAFLYYDSGQLNRTEYKMLAAVTALPAGERVISALQDPVSRVNGVTHIVDRVCVGKCFSYANYEPSTSQFRIRAVGRNAIVVDNYADSFALQHGTYQVKKQDPPLTYIFQCGLGLCSRPSTVRQPTPVELFRRPD